MYIGVVLKSTNISVGLVSETGQLAFQSSLPVNTQGNSDTIILDMIYIIKSISETVPLNLFNDRLTGIGIGVEGTIDKNTGKIVECSNAVLKNIPLKEIVERYFDVPVFVKGQAEASTLAHKEIEALKDVMSANSGVIAAGMLCKYIQ